MAKIGFIGTGTLAEAVIRGLQAAEGGSAHRFFLSPRSETRSRALAAAFDTVERRESNADVVAAADILCLGVLPKQIPDLKGLPFRPGQIVISFLAGVPLATLAPVLAPATRILRLLPLPGIEFGKGAILMQPADAEVAAIFAPVGDIVTPASEAEMEILGAATGLMSTYFAQQNTAIAWMEQRGIARATAARYLRSLFTGLSELALQMDKKDDPLPPEEYETAGGINQAARRFLQEAGWFDTFAQAMDRVEQHRATLMKPPA